MTYDDQTTIADFLTAAAGKQPAPGGGSVAALAGALAASMGEMVLNYSVGKKSLAAHQPQLTAALAQLTTARAMLLELMVEDQAAFQSLTDAKKLPIDSPDRAAQLAVLAKACVSVPAAVAATAVAILMLAESVAAVVNPFLLSDLAVCADLAMATVRCASYNVTVNLPELQDEADRAKASADMHAMLAHAATIIQRVSKAIWSRPGGAS